MTESPTGSPPGEEKEIPQLEGDDLTREFMQRLMATGITKEQALEEIQKTKERGGGR